MLRNVTPYHAFCNYSKSSTVDFVRFTLVSKDVANCSARLINFVHKSYSQWLGIDVVSWMCIGSHYSCLGTGHQCAPQIRYVTHQKLNCTEWRFAKTGLYCYNKACINGCYIIATEPMSRILLSCFNVFDTKPRLNILVCRQLLNSFTLCGHNTIQYKHL